MNAIEFVKEFGIDHAKRAVFREEAPYAKAVCVYNGRLTFSVSMGGPEWVLIADLKQIVDAWELVESYGGLETAKTCEYLEDLDHVKYNVGLAKAINLVEQCQ